MWSSILVVALLFALNPGVLGVIVLLISRPRPVQNLIAYWLGSVVVSVPLLLVPLILLHFAPSSVSFAHDLSTPSSPTARLMQIGMGALTLSIAALLTVRALARRRSALQAQSPRRTTSGRHRAPRGRARVPILAGNTSTMVLDPQEPAATLQSAGRGTDAAADGRSVFRRLVRRAYRAWENGSVWIAFVFGMTLFPGPPIVLFVVTTIASSGSAIGTEITAAVTFIVVMLALVEIILVSHLAAPAKTQTLLRPVHDWARAHRRQVIIIILAVIGIWQVVRGVGIG